VNEDIASSLDLPEAAGALVAKVFPQSPAEDGGIEVGDVIVEFDGRALAKSVDLPSMVADTAVGTEVEVAVIRKGKRRSVSVEIGKLEEEAVEATPVKAAVLGMSVQDITEEVARELDLGRDVKGVVVSKVERGSAAEKAGIRPGDVIEMFGNVPVEDAAGFRSMLKEREKGESVLVLVRRGDETLFRVLKPDEE